ncbi:hypothetical protein AVEN_73683-1 [Araneus ventricosus]|uniref:Uncharacterized protein n=1 Tax=Araneus ventricosus TaxID=182803 RepID=A0A4Y2HQM3_ARAVE|nr:hypothetical protein AVEN_73683-1 [Araneus ventricosus]
MTCIKDRKRSFDFGDNDESDFLLSTPKKSKKPTPKPKFNLDLSTDGAEAKEIPPYSINLGKGVVMEIKEFRSNYYVGLSKIGEGGNEVRNRFNMPLIQLDTLRKGCEAMLSYVKDCT